MGQHESSGPIWQEGAGVAAYPALNRDLTVEVCVIGGGIAGLSAAYTLAREGRRVAVVEAGSIGGGQTVRTTAHLSNALDRRYSEIIRLRGRDAARLAAESHTAAIERITQVVQDEQIDCNLMRLDGYLVPAEPGDESIEEEHAAARDAGLADVELLPRSPIPSLTTGPCLRFPQQGQFHPMRYLAGLAHAITKRHGMVFENSHVASIDGKHSQVVLDNRTTVRADIIIVATNTPVFDLVAIHTKQAPYTTYVVGLQIDAASIPHGLYWDTADPFHYVRLAHTGAGDGSAVLLIGGEDHKTGQADDGRARFKRLEGWARQRFPQAGAVAARWSGQVMETIDGLAFIGRNPLDAPNVYVATGDSGLGMTHGTIAGLLLTDMIMGRENRWASLYDPSRVPIATAGTLVRENLNVAAQFADWLAAGDVASVHAIGPGHGAILRRGLKKVAVYRDESGNLHVMSAACPHLGCMVAWNDIDRGWNCPCHGSRFDCYGHVTNGPANSNLRVIESARDLNEESAA